MTDSPSSNSSANQASSVLYETRGAVALVTLNRPQALNSFTRQMHHDLWTALDLAEADPTIRALVITGAGRGFCAGADLSEFDFAPGPDLVKRADPGPVIDQAFNPTARRLQNLRMPYNCGCQWRRSWRGCIARHVLRYRDCSA
jgi:2-(1,2-epoxy-1,2-dihydrophenyl)acetyl-CoA isomerase